MSPDYLALGNPTLDVRSWAPLTVGGSVVYSAVQAARLGLRSAIVGRADPVAWEPYWCQHAGEVELHLQPSPSVTMFSNAHVHDAREQWVKAWAGPIEYGGSLPASEILHIAPVAQEIVPEELLEECRSRLVCLTPQGLLRRWDEAGGHVSLVRRDFAASLARVIDIVVVSEFEARYVGDLLAGVAGHGGIAVVTQGSRGGEILTGDRRTHFTAFPAPRVVDTTGAGDCFAAALSVAVYRGWPLTRAARAAAVAASLCVGGLATVSVGAGPRIEQELLAANRRPGRS